MNEKNTSKQATDNKQTTSKPKYTQCKNIAVDVYKLGLDAEYQASKQTESKQADNKQEQTTQDGYILVAESHQELIMCNFNYDNDDFKTLVKNYAQWYINQFVVASAKVMLCKELKTVEFNLDNKVKNIPVVKLPNVLSLSKEQAERAKNLGYCLTFEIHKGKTEVCQEDDDNGNKIYKFKKFKSSELTNDFFKNSLFEFIKKGNEYIEKYIGIQEWSEKRKEDFSELRKAFNEAEKLRYTGDNSKNKPKAKTLDEVCIGLANDTKLVSTKDGKIYRERVGFSKNNIPVKYISFALKYLYHDEKPSKQADNK